MRKKQFEVRFKSVNDRTLRRLKRYCLKFTRRKYPKCEPNAAKPMLEVVHDIYGAAYTQLKSDYITRLGNLEHTYGDGLAQAESMYIVIEQLAKEHEIALQDYYEKCEKYGFTLPNREEYGFPIEEITERKQIIKRLNTENAHESQIASQVSMMAKKVKEVNKKNEETKE